MLGEEQLQPFALACIRDYDVVKWSGRSYSLPLSSPASDSGHRARSEASVVISGKTFGPLSHLAHFQTREGFGSS